MPSLKDIRTRIDTTKNTQQITKAMKLVATAKLRKAQHQIVNMRPYAHTLLKVIADIAATNRIAHPLMTPPLETKKVLLVVITSDRGLCGALNTNANKWTETYVKENKNKLETVDFIFLGKKGSEYFARRGVKPLETMVRLDRDVSYGLAASFAEKLMKKYIDGDYDEIRIVYNEFVSAISQRVKAETILPVDLSAQTFEESVGSNSFAKDMIYEPNPDVIIEQLLAKHFSMQVYRCMCENVAAEHGARMSAMENASNNAKEVINKLTLTYNKLRQEKITTELTEIVSGAEAL